MITKFEKRIIAFLLAALMCSPVTAFSAVTVNAEETQETVQQEAQTNVQGDETAVQDSVAADAAAEDPASDVQQDTPTEGQSVNDLDDGAFIPIQEEQYEEEPDVIYSEESASEEMQQAEEEIEIYAAERAANSDVPDEELEKVALGENGEPVRMTTVIEMGEESVRYLFQPEESGEYYLDIMGMGSFNIQEKTNSGASYIASETSYDDYASGVFDLESGKTYYINIRSTQAGEAGTVVWKLGQVQEITSGSYETTISVPGEREHYHLAYGETDIYYFGMDEDSGGYFTVRLVDEGGSYSSTFSYSGYQKLDFNRDCYIDIYYYNDANTTGKINWSVSELIAQEVTEDEEVHTVAEGGMPGPVYRFVPKETNQYKISSGSVTVYDASWNWVGSSRVNLTAGEVYYIKFPDYYSTTELEWNIKKLQEIEIQEGGSYVTSPDQSVIYTFVPEETGRYHFWSEDSADIEIDKKDGYYTQRGYGFDELFILEAGAEYTIELTIDTDKGNGVIWHVEMTEPVVIQEGVKYNTAQEHAEAYKFVPDSTGYYILDSDGRGQCQVYDADWKQLTSYNYDMADYETNNGFGLNIYLEAGHTYYFDILPSEDNAEWQINFVQTSGDYSYYVRENGTVEIVQYIGDDSTVDIPESIDGFTVDSIGHGAFQENTQLEAVTIPNKVTELQYSAFESCSNLKNVVFESESTLKSIGGDAFRECSSLERVEIPDSVQDSSYGTFALCTSLKEVILGTGLEKIGSSMFLNCENLTSIDIPDNITCIGQGAFNGTGLEAVDLPDSVTDIRSSAFANNKNLKTVSIPNSVTELAYYTFQNCESLLEIAIPDSVERIREDALDNTAWYNNQEDGLVYAGKVLYQYKGEAPQGTVIIVKDGTKGISDDAFNGQSGITEIKLPNTVTNIGYTAFRNCELLNEIEIPQSVTDIGYMAFGYLDYGEKVEGFTIYGTLNSEAQRYAKLHGFTFIEAEPDYTLGDVDENGSVDISDLRLVLRAVCGKTELTENQKLAADVETDNDVNIQDLRKILRYVCRKIDSFE